MQNRSIMLGVGAILMSLTDPAGAEAALENWPAWRGPTLNGVALKGSPPVSWSETENVKWKVELPGAGSSTPVVWGDKIFIQTAIPTAEESARPAEPEAGGRGPRSTPTPTVPYKFNVLCLDRATGKTIWERTARESVPHEGHHPTGSYASYSPVTDGKLLWVSFASRGLHCYDVDGNHQWSRELIEMRSKLSFGEGSSPALAGDLIVVVMDHEGDSKIAAFNKNTGDPVWETPREESTAWATPVPVDVNGEMQIVTNATHRVRGYDAKSGELIWECGGQTMNTIPSPVVGFGNVYCTSGFRGSSLLAIKLGQSGDLSRSDAIAWEIHEGTPYVASPLLYDQRIYILSSLNAILSSYDAVTGEPVYTDERLEGLRQVYASPVGADGRIYISDREGTTIVVRHADTFEVLATNQLDNGFDASPVVVGDELFLKGSTHLYCIAES
jgi:outer membrane protein assembly factor BamB